MTTIEREDFITSNIFPKGRPLLKWEYAEAMGINPKNFSRDMRSLCNRTGLDYESEGMVFYVIPKMPEFYEDILEFRLEEQNAEL